MSLSREALIELMALADGELEGEEKERVERLAASSDEARRHVGALRAPALGILLGETMARRTMAADGIADAVMGRLASQVPAADADSAQVRRVDVDSGRRRPLNGRSPARRVLTVSTMGLGLGAAVALAAGVAMYVRSAAPAPGLAPVARVNAPGAETASSTAQREGVMAGRGVVVDEIDSPSRDVSIFQIPNLENASASSSVVVWIDDDPGAR